MPFSTIASTITAAEVLIPSAIAILAVAIVAWESTRRAHSVGSAKVLRFPAWTRLVVLTLVFLAGLSIWVKFHGSEVQQQQSPATVAGFSAACLVVAILMAMFFRATVQIDDTGLHARPAFRQPRSIAWDEIAEVRTNGDIITIIGLAGTRIRIVTMMIGVREFRAELAARRPDKLPTTARRST